MNVPCVLSQRNFRSVLTVLIFSFIACSAASGIPSDADSLLEQARLLDEKILNLYKTGRYAEAVPLAVEAYRIRAGIWGEDDARMSESTGNLAVLHEMTGQPDKAEVYYRRALVLKEKAEGPDSMALTLLLDRLAGLCTARQRYDEALQMHQRSLSIREKTHGLYHDDTAAALARMAALLYRKGDFAQSALLYRRVLDIRENTAGKEHPLVVEALGNLAQVSMQTDRASAEQLFRRALAMHEQAKSRDTVDTVNMLNNLGLLCKESRRFDEAAAFYVRALKISEKLVGKEHVSYATTSANLAALYQNMGRFSDAAAAYYPKLSYQEKTLGKGHPLVGNSLSRLGLMLEEAGRLAEAEDIFRRALAIMEAAYGRDHSHTATLMSNLSGIFFKTARYAEAEQFSLDALRIREKELGKDHIDVAASLNNIATMYFTSGRYSQSEPLFRRALAIMEKKTGKDHQHVASALNNMAQMYSATGRLSEGAGLLQRALAIREKALGSEHPDVAAALNNLATIYMASKRYADAEPLFRRAYAIVIKAFGEEHPAAATAMNNLSAVCEQLGNGDEANDFMNRAYAVRERVLGPEHPDMAVSLNNKAMSLARAGRSSEAENLLKKAHVMMEKSVTDSHPNMWRVLSNLAGIYAMSDRHDEAHAYFIRSITLEEKERENAFSVLSERQKLAFVEQYSILMGALVGHTAEYKPGDHAAVEKTLNAWLKWKGSVLEAQGRYQEALFRSGNPDMVKKSAELAGLRQQLIRMQAEKPAEMSLSEYRDALKDLRKMKEETEAELAGMSAPYSLDRLAEGVDANVLRSRIGNNAVYIDFAYLQMPDFRKLARSKPHYFVFVLHPRKQEGVQLLDLGDAAEIDSHIAAYHEEMRRAAQKGEAPRADVLRREQASLHEKVMKPLEEAIKGKTRIFVSPDGNLNLIPFEVFSPAEGASIMERHSLIYLTAGRDIVRFDSAGHPRGESFVIADPDYDLGLKERQAAAISINSSAGRLRGEIAGDLAGTRFRRLRDTKIEAENIAGILRDKGEHVRLYTGRQAIEETLYSADSARAVHIATHGFFLKSRQPKQGELPAQAPELQDLATVPSGDNPMLRSGLVFAGVNASLQEGRDEGIVTAEKVLGLKLKGTELVVLSACETGVGEVQNGEGVFGLKRAFILAGVQTLVVSLWSVPSRETTALMSDFYRLMSEGRSKHDALREAKLNMMKKNANPFYWGAFILVGNPR